MVLVTLTTMPEAAPMATTLTAGSARVELQPATLRIVLPRWRSWTALHLATMALWLVLAISPLGYGVATAVVVVPWMLDTWKRGWRRAHSPAIEGLARGLSVTTQGDASGYRDMSAKVEILVDGRAIPREEITGVALAPRTLVTVSREGSEQRSSRGAEMFLLLRTRVVRVLDAPEEAVQKVAASLSTLLALGAAHTLLPEVQYQFRFGPRSPQGRARAANFMQRDPRAPTSSTYYGGMRVLGALLAVYLCSLPALMVFGSLSGEPWRLTPRAGLMSLGGFWLADALAVVVWGACFRRPMQDYARERFGVAAARR
jgi:hypothetical protein